MKSNIGEFLVILRKSKGMTQQEVADRLSVSNKTVSSWETGASCPDISMLPAIAELFGVTCDELLRGERIPADEPTQKSEEKREKSLQRLLAMYRNNATVTSWICIGLYLVAVVAALLIGCAALESLIGFFVGVIFIIGGVLLCLIQCRYLRFQLTQNDFDSAAVDDFLHALSRRQTLTLILAMTAFGFIFPHIFPPVHTGLLLGYALLYGLIGAAGSTLLALLIAWITRTAKKSYRTDRQKFFWTLKNGVIPYGIICALSAIAIAVGLSMTGYIPQPMGSVNTYHADTYATLLDYLRENTGLFSEFEHTLHETDEVETTLSDEELNAPISEETCFQEYTIGKASYLFPDFPSQFEDDYACVSSDGGVYVEVEVLTLTLPDGGIISSPVFNPEMQGGILDLQTETAMHMYEETSYSVFLACDTPLYEVAQAQRIHLMTVIAIAAPVAGGALLLGIYTAIYIPRRKKFLKNRSVGETN